MLTNVVEYEAPTPEELVFGSIFKSSKLLCVDIQKYTSYCL